MVTDEPAAALDSTLVGGPWLVPKGVLWAPPVGSADCSDWILSNRNSQGTGHLSPLSSEQTQEDAPVTLVRMAPSTRPRPRAAGVTPPASVSFPGTGNRRSQPSRSGTQGRAREGLRPRPSCPLAPGLECQPPALCLRKTERCQLNCSRRHGHHRTGRSSSTDAELREVANTQVNLRPTLSSQGVSGCPRPPL